MPTKKELQDKIDMLNDALEASLAASPERDNNFFTGGLSDLYTDRNAWDRKKVFAEALRAWRVNPIARRIVRLMTSFIIGKTLKIKAADPAVQTFLDDWWKRNDLTRNLRRWKDEDTRTGNLFILFNVQADGMSILRAVPAEQIEEIETDPNDIESELRYFKDPSQTEAWQAYADGATRFIRHYASNKPVGSAWGEADLSPLLVWIGRYSSWLEDRVRLNRFRTAFTWLVVGRYKSEAERATREKYINQNPPKPGSILVLNAEGGEAWAMMSPQLDSFDASMDGLTLKKMIAAGVGFPMHYLAEPEGATQTTAEAAGTPTFRTLEEAQSDFFEMVLDLARYALRAAGRNADAEIQIEGSDITERDNAALALALGRAYPNLSDLFDREAIDADEFMRLVYKMFAEVWKGKTPNIQRKPLIEPKQTPASYDDKTDPNDPKEDVQNAQPPNVTVTMPPTAINLTVPEQPAPIVNITNPAPQVTVKNDIPEQTPPEVTVINQVETPDITVENQTPALATEPALRRKRKKK